MQTRRSSRSASNMLDTFVPHYLIERVEVQLSHGIINGQAGQPGDKVDVVIGPVRLSGLMVDTN